MQVARQFVRSHVSVMARPMSVGSLLSIRSFSSSRRRESMFEAYGKGQRHADGVDPKSYHIISRPVGPYAMNQYFVCCPVTMEAAIIDAGLQKPKVFLQMAEDLGAEIKHIIQTHAHIDHVAGITSTKEALPEAPIYLHPLDGPLYDATSTQSERFGLESLPALPPWDIDLTGHHPGSPFGTYTRNDRKECSIICIGETIRLTVIHTPGHCPGHVCLYDERAKVLFGGDLLFQGSVGRTDLPGANPQHMRESLAKMKQLPPETTVFPGHGAPTTIGDEIQNNPFMQDDMDYYR